MTRGPTALAFPPSPPPVPAAASTGGTSGDRVIGFDLARGLAFLGMVVVNYRVMLGFGAREPEYLATFLGRFTGRAAPLFVMLAGIGVTLLFRAGMRRRDAIAARGGSNQRRGSDAIKALAMSAFCAVGMLVIGYHAYSKHHDLKGASLSETLVGLAEGDESITQGVPDRALEYVDTVTAGADPGLNQLFMWSGGAILLSLIVWVVFGTRDPRWTLWRRALFLLVIGFAWRPWWEGDILHWYGVFLGVSVLLVGLRWWLVVPALLATMGARAYLRSVENWPDWVGWDRALEYEQFWEVEGQARSLLYNGWHPVFPWMAFFIVGILLGRIPMKSIGARVALLAVGAGLWLGTDAARPEIWKTLRKTSHTNVASEFTVTPAALPEGFVIDVGQRARPLEFPTKAEGMLSMFRRGRGTRVKGKIADGVDRRAHRKTVTAARRITRILSAIEHRAPYSDWTFLLEPDGDRVRAVLEVSYGEDRAAYLDHEAHRDHVVHDVASIMHPLHPDDQLGFFTLGGFRDWPEAISEIHVRRRLLCTNAAGDQQSHVVDTVTVAVTKAQGLTPVYLRLSRQTSTDSMPPGPLYVLSACGTSFIVIALSLLLAGFAFFRKLLHPVICAGQMALTLYIAHVIVGLTLITMLGFDIDDNLYAITACIGCCFVFSMAFATAWRAYFRRGPCETAMRWLTG